MNMVTDPTTLPLRDIHLPESVSWWPVAPGWWLLLLLLVLLTWFIRSLLRRRRDKRRSVDVQARKELQRIRDEFEGHANKSRLARDISELIRRTSISLFPRQEVASLTGEEWLEFLNRQTAEPHFSEQTGRALIEAPYRDNVEFDHEVLLRQTEAWLHTVLDKHRSMAR